MDSLKFKPHSSLTLADAAYSLIWARHFKDMMYPQSVDISYSMTSYIDQPYSVSIILKSKDGKLLDYIQEKDIVAGYQSIAWAPLIDGAIVNPGEYIIEVEIYEDEMVKNKKEYEVEQKLIILRSKRM